MTWSRGWEEDEGIETDVGSESGIGRKEEYNLGGIDLCGGVVVRADLRFDALGILVGGARLCTANVRKQGSFPFFGEDDSLGL